MLLAAVLVARGCGSGAKLSEERAIEIARPHAGFRFQATQVRYVQRGINARGVWAVSFYNGPATRPTKVKVILVDARTGGIVSGGR